MKEDPGFLVSELGRCEAVTEKEKVESGQGEGGQTKSFSALKCSHFIGKQFCLLMRVTLFFTKAIFNSFFPHKVF